MLILPPPQMTLDNISTQIKHKIEYVQITSSSTKLYSDFWKDKRTCDINPFLRPRSTATQFEIKENYIPSNSTWDDSLFDDFDIVSKFSYGKHFKVKAKVVSVSKFVPNIVIE